MSLFDEAAACPVCGGDCLGFPDTQHDITYPFIGGGVVAQKPEQYVNAPHRIDNPDGGPALYGTGDPIPLDEAVRLGLAEHHAKDAPEQDRARKPRLNRRKKTE